MMKQLFVVVIGLLISVQIGSAQGVDQTAPSSITPKPVPSGFPPAPQPGRPRSPRPEEGNQPLNPGLPDLKISAIIIVKSRDEVHEAGVTGTSGVQVKDVPFLTGPDFQQQMHRYIGQPLTANRIRDIEDDIILYARDHGKILVDVILLEQVIENGAIQLWVLEGKVGKVTIKNEGKKWFSDEVIANQLRLRPAQSVDSHELQQDLNWVNNNPFRQVDVSFKPGTNLGLTDVELQVEDRFPLRPYFGYENSGTRFTGPDRLLFGFNWGNAFWQDHQLNYQYATDVEFDLVKAHSASYIAPLPWHHTVIVYGAYVEGKADFSSIGFGTTADGISWQTSIRYSVPLPDIQRFRHEVSGGFDFKRSNNDLGAGGSNVLQHSDTDIDQFVLGYTGIMPDPFGRTSFGAEFFYSPGDLTEFNNNQDFNQLRVGSKADYFYFRLNAERITRLPYNFSWVLRGLAQASNHRLNPSEELAIGGWNTVRGYDERVVSGDNGWTISNEIRTPAWSPSGRIGNVSMGNVLGVENGYDAFQLLAFVDYGAVRVIDPVPADGTDPDKDLWGIGVGIRYTVSKNLAFRFDYGWALTDKSINENPSRSNIGVLLSF
jgi:hemolysin activation/secretion protein